MTKTISTLTLVSALFLGGATAHAGEGAAQRGQVSVDGPAVKAVVAGPITVRAYSEFSGGALYTALAVTGTDADCKGQAASPPTTNLGADVVVSFNVPAGQIACLTTSNKLEVLWRSLKAPAVTDAPGTMMARR